ncbi:hypothetical protein GCM10018793_21950 [Streptomyces sulfonofaciens]|uniref:Uncharacterized protein n=1 Tax=Streptomyces sulfonofaciens TaxID=68272 RepID=A0A919G1M6_9ACTN|nr:putative leader peptide [Streptomyces sulfonofaciens]GHH76385.1 hypothetical protein GCM10018793_21950 [Streptomyces sulfonofaciens]
MWARGPARLDEAGAVPVHDVHILAEGAEVLDMRSAFRLPVPVLSSRHPVHLYTRPHIDLQRVAGALCCS